MPDSLYLVGYWAISLLQLFVNQVVMSKKLKLTLFFNQVVSIHDQKLKTKIQYLES